MTHINQHWKCNTNTVTVTVTETAQRILDINETPDIKQPMACNRNAPHKTA